MFRGKLAGMLYLENRFSTDAFTPERLQVIQLLSSQTAISIQNARLYGNLEERVQERTSELTQVLEELKTIQQQLVEREKMASLGGLFSQ